MKIKTKLILANILGFALASTTIQAAPMVFNEMFSTMDAEYSYIDDDSDRVNFHLSSMDSDNLSYLQHHVLSASDGEGDYIIEGLSSSRINYSLESTNISDSVMLHHALTGIDGEWDY